MIAPKLKAGDGVRIIAPARSRKLPFISDDIKKDALQNLEKLGLSVSFGKHIDEVDEFYSTSVEHRLEDLHDAFADKNVKAILTVIGGFNSNQLLQYIDYKLIKKNPKILCGYSDITALQHAIYKETGLVTYSGPHYFTFGRPPFYDYTVDYFKKCLFDDKPFEIMPAKLVGEHSSKESIEIEYQNSGFWLFQKGTAKGKILGANLCTLNLLQGTEFMPDIRNCILFVEDDGVSDKVTFDRDLQSLMQLPGAKSIKALVIGRFQKESDISMDILERIIRSKKELKKVPIIANVDFGHTYPMITYPIGGEASIKIGNESAELKIIKH